MTIRKSVVRGAVCLALLSTAIALAHEDEHGGHGGDAHAGTASSSSSPHDGHHPNAPPDNSSAPAGPDAAPVYFRYADHRGLLVAHIVTMVLAWVFLMPVASLLALAHSRFHLPAQLAFLLANGVGVGLAAVYNGLTPDLYPNNSHHKLGWALAWILGAQAALGVLGAIVRNAGPSPWSSKEERAGFMPVPTLSPGDGAESHLYRHSGDSGHGVSIDAEREELEARGWTASPPEGLSEKRWSALAKLEDVLSRRAPFVFSDRVACVCGFAYSLVARLLIPLGFVQLALGVVTGSGIFMGSGVFNGLAHFIKGGIFFMYGTLTLGRWLGAFAELGWAWNVKPPAELDAARWRARAPSMEMVESALIFVYGCANVFLEHLAGWGGAWTHSDLQHVSIAFMFFGGGLCGILVESRTIRSLLNHRMSNLTARPTISTSYGYDAQPTAAGEDAAVEKGTTASFNPLPAMIIFLLGIMMSSHHQHSALSTTIHVQWGALLSGAAVFRLLTYMLFFRAPPTSYLPSRPPTEVVAAFGLMAGGIVFMISNRETVNWLDALGVDAMFGLVVTVGFTALLMSWVTGAMAIKAAALRRENKRLFSTRDGSAAS